MPLLVTTKHVVLIQTPKFNVEDPNWLPHRNHLVAQAGLLRLEVKVYDLGGMMHDFQYFSKADTVAFWEAADQISSERCGWVWFTGAGVCEAARSLVILSCRCGRPVSYVGLRRGQPLAGFIAWHAVSSEAEQRSRHAS